MIVVNTPVSVNPYETTAKDLTDAYTKGRERRDTQNKAASEAMQSEWTKVFEPQA